MIRKATLSKVLATLALFAAIAAFLSLDLGSLLTLEYLKAKQGALARLYAEYPARTLAAYFALYAISTGASLPGATILTIASGALFGVVTGAAVVSVASTTGATLAFLSSRFLLRDFVQTRFSERLRTINAGMDRSGLLYLFSLRLVPVVPFFVLNLAMGVTTIPLLHYALVSLVGMLPATLLYANAGTQLAELESPSGILSFDVVASFAALGLLPFVARRCVQLLRTRAALGRYEKPKTFDYNVIVIGAGAAGLVAAYIATTLRAKVALVEQGRMGGDCLNTGCVPSKALLQAAKVVAQFRRARDFGLDASPAKLDFAATLARVRRVIESIEPHDSVERYRALGVDVHEARATVVSPYQVDLRSADGDTRRLTTRSIILATGAEPHVPELPGLAGSRYVTSETVWSLDRLPRRLAVLGGGPVGCEFAQAFQRFGTAVTIVEQGASLLPNEDAAAAEVIAKQLKGDGVRLLVGHSAVEVDHLDATTVLRCTGPGKTTTDIPFDVLLVATGRRPRTTGYGLEDLGVQVDERGAIAANGMMQTNLPNIYVCGDAVGPLRFTHVAAHQAWYATVNALFSPLKTFEVDVRVLPRCLYTDPELAHVGFTEADAQRRDIAFEVTRYDLEGLDRALTDGNEAGFVKVITARGRDRILGVTVVGAHAGETIAEFVLAMKHGIGLRKILATVHPYPTMAEANRHVAGSWAQAHKPERLLALLARVHAWRRG